MLVVGGSRDVSQGRTFLCAVLPTFNMDERILIQVVDVEEKPFSCAVIENDDTGARFFTGTNGVMPFFPSIDAATSQGGKVQLRAYPYGACGAQQQECGELFEVALDAMNATLDLSDESVLPTQLDVAFVLDTTGSMCDEMEYLQKETAVIFDNLRTRRSGVDAKMAVVLYKD